jgi:IclR family transcriptional regulator, KDG regulon repressor
MSHVSRNKRNLTIEHRGVCVNQWLLVGVRSFSLVVLPNYCYYGTMNKDDSSTIQSVDRALQLLKYIADTPDGSATLGELTDFIGLDKSSVFRLLATLWKHELVRQDPGSRSYQLGFGIYRLAGSLQGRLSITEVARPYLRKIVRETKENAQIAVRSQNLAVFIDRERGSRTLSANMNPGDTEELHCTAVGKSLICRLSQTELKDILGEGPFVSFTDRTLTDYDALLEDLRLTRERGYAIDNEEYEMHVVCVAAPIYNYDGRAEAAIGISGLRERIGPKVTEYGEFLRGIAAELSEKIGSKEKGKPTSGKAPS